MPTGIGSLSKLAFKKDRGLYGGGPAITYPDTPGVTDMAAGHSVPAAVDALGQSLDRADDPALVGSQGLEPSPVIAKKSAGLVSGMLRYRGWERLICMAIGFEPPDHSATGSPAFVGTPDSTKTVTDATNATPIVITTSAAHGYANGDGIRIAGVTGNTAANGDWTIAAVTSTTFELVESAGNGAFGGSPTSAKFRAFAHLFEMDESLLDMAWSSGERASGGWSSNDRKVRRGQFGIAKQVQDWVWSSIMVNKMTISGTPSETKIEFDVIPYGLVRGSYNSSNWTLPTGVTVQALFQSAVVGLALRSVGDPLTVVAPGNFELTVDNGLVGDDQTTTSGVNIIQPARDGKRKVSLKFEFPRYTDTDTAFLDNADIDSEFAASILLTGSVFAGGMAHKIGMYMSSIRFDPSFYAIPTDSSGPHRKTYVFGAHKPNGSDIFDASHYGGVTTKKDSELVVVMQNQDPINYLLEV